MTVLPRCNTTTSAIVLFIVYFFICVDIGSNEAARILAIFPAPSISHQVVFRPLTQALAKRGHEIVVITPDPAFQKVAILLPILQKLSSMMFHMIFGTKNF